MKIGIVSGEFPPMRGGVGDFTRELSNALAHNHHEVYLLLPDGSEWDHDLPNVSVSSQIKKWGWKTATTMTRWAESEHLDVINLQYQTAAYNMHLAINLLPGRLGSAPLVVTFHDLNPPYLFPKAGWLRNAVVTRLARRASGVIVTNQEDEKKLCDLKVSLARIPIGSNIPCAPPEDFDAIKFRAGIGVEPQDLLLAYFGFLNQSKGGDVLVKTLNTLRDHGVPAKLLLIGGRTGSSDPTNRAFADHIDTMISRMGLSEMVLMTGYVPAEQVSAALLSADICVLPFRDGISLRRG
ncbi:MAG: glycosyltransferase family 4 protein, partial [Chloroflexota bacterium]